MSDERKKRRDPYTHRKGMLIPCDHDSVADRLRKKKRLNL